MVVLLPAHQGLFQFKWLSIVMGCWPFFNKLDWNRPWWAVMFLQLCLAFAAPYAGHHRQHPPGKQISNQKITGGTISWAQKQVSSGQIMTSSTPSGKFRFTMSNILPHIFPFISLHKVKSSQQMYTSWQYSKSSQKQVHKMIKARGRRLCGPWLQWW